MKTALGLLTLLFCTSATLAAHSSRYLIQPRTLASHASFINSAMQLRDSDRVIYFPKGGINGELLIRIPLGEMDPHAVIKITVALRKPEQDPSDPHIGLSDRLTQNLFRINSVGLCNLQGGSESIPDLPHGSTMHYEYTMLFEPHHRYGACSHLGGHITPGYWNQYIYPKRGLDLVVRREGSGEEYYFYYFLVEVDHHGY